MKELTALPPAARILQHEADVLAILSRSPRCCRPPSSTSSHRRARPLARPRRRAGFTDAFPSDAPTSRLETDRRGAIEVVYTQECPPRRGTVPDGRTLSHQHVVRYVRTATTQAANASLRRAEQRFRQLTETYGSPLAVHARYSKVLHGARLRKRVGAYRASLYRDSYSFSTRSPDDRARVEEKPAESAARV